jgi:cation diffusion facilitator CzcD-associated flavoprotein CzcO
LSPPVDEWERPVAEPQFHQPTPPGRFSLARIWAFARREAIELRHDTVRLVFATDYLQTLMQPHVEVVSSPARYLRSRSLVTEDGSEFDVDVVLCATGYAAADYLGQIDVVGEGGTSLRNTWSDGAYAYLGMVVPDFPNFFMLNGRTPTSGPTASSSCWRRRPATSCAP